jgi:hypothetical protein
MLIYCNMFILYITSRYSHFNILFSKPCQRQYEYLPSLGVRRLSFIYFSHFNLLLYQMNWNLVGSIYGRFSLKSAHFVMIHYQTWPPQAILVSDWPIFKNLLLWKLKPLGQINQNLVGSIFTKLDHMIALWKGKNPIYFGVIRSKVTITINIIFYRLIIYIDGRILWCTHFLLILE